MFRRVTAVNDALRIQVSGNRRLGHILLLMGALSEDQLANTLSQQLNIPLTNVAEIFSEDVKQLLPPLSLHEIWSSTSLFERS